MKTTTTTTSINRPWIPRPKLRTFSPKTFSNNPLFKLPNTALESIPRSALIVKCSENGSVMSGTGTGGSLKDMVDERVEQLLNKEENRVLLNGLEQASQRVEIARTELAEFERQEIEAKIMRDYINQLESRASEIAECQKEIMEARVMVEEAERSLRGNEVMNKNEERLESMKAALIAAVIGTLEELLISLTRASSYSELILPLAITFASCALFGVTFRYAIRRDLDDFHLKSGIYAAFGFVKGLGMLGGGTPLELEAGSIQSLAIDCAVYVSESFLTFLFAGVALDFCIKLGVLSTFPIDRSVPRR